MRSVGQNPVHQTHPLEIEQFPNPPNPSLLDALTVSRSFDNQGWEHLFGTPGNTLRVPQELLNALSEPCPFRAGQTTGQIHLF